EAPTTGAGRLAPGGDAPGRVRRSHPPESACPREGEPKKPHSPHGTRTAPAWPRSRPTSSARAERRADARPAPATATYIPATVSQRCYTRRPASGQGKPVQVRRGPAAVRASVARTPWGGHWPRGREGQRD